MFSIRIIASIIHNMDTSQNQTSKSYWQLWQCFWQNFHWNFSAYYSQLTSESKHCVCKILYKISSLKVWFVTYNLFECFLPLALFLLLYWVFMFLHIFLCWQSNWGFKYARQGLYHVFSLSIFYVNFQLISSYFTIWKNLIFVHKIHILSFTAFALQFSIYIYSLMANWFSICEEQRVIFFTCYIQFSYIWNCPFIFIITLNFCFMHWYDGDPHNHRASDITEAQNSQRHCCRHLAFEPSKRWGQHWSPNQMLCLLSYYPSIPIYIVPNPYINNFWTRYLSKIYVILCFMAYEELK